MKNRFKKNSIFLLVMIITILALSLVACNQSYPKAKTDDMIAELQTTIDRNKTELAKKIADLTKKHDTQFEEFKQAVFNDEQLLSDLKNSYTEKILELENADAANKKAITDLKAEYDAKIKELQNGSGSGNGTNNSEAIAQLKAEYDAKISKLEKAIDDNKKAIADLTAEYTAKVEEVEDEIAEANATILANKTALESSIANLKTAYQTKVSELEALLETVQNTQITQGEKIAELERKVAEILERLEPNVCTVTFDSNGGTPVASQTVNKNEKITRPENPTKEGLVFDDWYIEDEMWSFHGHFVTENITLKANWVSIGVTYALSGDGMYSVVGADNNLIGETVIIDSTYKGLPIKAIGNEAFKDCTNLKSIVISDSVTSIGYAAFNGCNNLKSITLPFVGHNRDTTTKQQTSDKVSPYSFGYIFGGNRKSVSATRLGGSSKVPEPPESTSSWIYQGASATLDNSNSSDSYTDHYYFYGYFIPASLRSVTIMNVTAISAYAFYGCTMLTSVTIPDNVTIGSNAFTNCVSPTRVSFSAN